MYCSCVPCVEKRRWVLERKVGNRECRGACVAVVLPNLVDLSILTHLPASSRDYYSTSYLLNLPHGAQT
jgi:hypothetical protein